MSRLVAVIFIMTFTSATARAAPPTTQPGSALRQFDEESRALYASVHGAVLRAEVPVLRDPPGPDELLRKWKHKLDPAFRAKLEQELRDRAAPGRQQAPVPGSATRPVAEWILVGSCLVVGDDGRVLVPAYVDGPTLGGRKVRVFAADGAVRTAALVGVDRPTNLSVLKLDQPPARSVRFSAQRPVPGQLLMVISGDDTQWVAWSGVVPASGVMVGCDGTITGYARGGRLVGGPAYAAVLEQLATRGRVARPSVGAQLVEMHDEPGGRSVVKVAQVVPGSPAARAGLRRDDVLRSIGGSDVSDLPSIAAELARQRGAVPLVVARDGEDVTLTVDLQPPTDDAVER